MSEEGLEIVRGVYARWGAGDLRTDDVFDPHVVFVLRPEFPEPGPYLGIEGIARYTRALLAAWSRFSISAEGLVPAGDSVVAAVVQRAVGTESDAETELRYYHAWTLRGGKVIRLESIRTRPEALSAVGLDEAPGLP
jgi:uncharacterized protein